MWFAISILRPLSRLFTRRVWRGQEHIPPVGGVIIASNHVSWIDPFTLGHFVFSTGRLPRFMGKESLFRVPVTGWILRGARQIPVRRGERDGAGALQDAVEALRNGEAVLIYPEGTITRDPDYWPMQAKTGVARLALMSGAPVIPVAQWGPQEILGKARRLRLLPRKTVRISAGEPLRPPPLVEGELIEGATPSREALQELTGDVMRSIRLELEAIRGEAAPEGIWDPRREVRRSPAAELPDPGVQTSDEGPE